MIKDKNDDGGANDRVFRPGLALAVLPADLLIVMAVLILTLIAIYLPVIDGTIIRVALGLLFVLIVPGYALMAALFPGKSDISVLERVAFSLGISTASVALIGLALNYTPWGIRLDPVVVCLVLITLVLVSAAWLRRRKLPADERFDVDVKGTIRAAINAVFPPGRDNLDKALTVVLLLSIIFCVAMAAYVVGVPGQGEKFTELYLLGPGGKASNYTTVFAASESSPVIVGVGNHEYRDMAYELVVTESDGMRTDYLYRESLVVPDNSTREEAINIRPGLTGDRILLRFMLYADGNSTTPYRECHIWAKVTANGTDVIQ